VQQASNEVVKILNSSTPHEGPKVAEASSATEDKTDSKPVDGTTKPTTSEKENAPAKKMYCN
jgi:hypothetical protein